MATKERIEFRIKLVEAEIDYVLNYRKGCIGFNQNEADLRANELRIELKTLKWVLNNGN